ncbi:MAG: radical SAM protein [Desulfobacterales bacterium]|nr:radical SAM protein [Desulfobacterales bacterium]
MTSIKNVVLIQLPIPQLDFARKTGNIPLAAAWLKHLSNTQDHIEILPESMVSYLGDRALCDFILSKHPDIIGFSVYNWNADRTVYIARQIKSQRSDVRIVFGGPEITVDNERILSNSVVDFFVHGEGEIIFQRLLQDTEYWKKRSGSEISDGFFERAYSPYMQGLLEPEIENMMFLETQRGCPYHCSYCYYNKSRPSVTLAKLESILQGIQWAYDYPLKELFLIDPCLNARPDLLRLLKGIQQINQDRRLSILSELRAELIDSHIAEQFALAGFTEFEIGLQSINPKALKILRRPTDLNQFISGVTHLKKVGIRAKIDLIVGLPLDTPEGFKKSVDFLVEHNMTEDIQVFVLSILPGTTLRTQADSLGLSYNPLPPYTVVSTPSFTRQDIHEALMYAQDTTGINLFPESVLDLSMPCQSIRKKKQAIHTKEINGFVQKIVIQDNVDICYLVPFASKLTSPYQIFFLKPQEKTEYLLKIISFLSSQNPFTPFEIVLFDPREFLLSSVLGAATIQRPHYLDIEFGFQYPEHGNRSVLITIVTSNPDLQEAVPMQRQVYWWKNQLLPSRLDLDKLDNFDGIFFDTSIETDLWSQWQDHYFFLSNDLPLISFSESFLQDRWMNLTMPNEFTRLALNPT